MKPTSEATAPQGSKPKTRAKKPAHSAHDDTESGHRFKNFTLVTQWILRECSPFFSSNQTMILLFVADRTYGWGKLRETITHSHFLEGIPATEEGKLDYAGKLSMTRPTLTESLKKLKSFGVLKTRTVRKLTEYEINLEWLPVRPGIGISEVVPLAESAEKGKNSFPKKGKFLSLKKGKGKNGKVKKVDTTYPRAAPASLPAERPLDECLEAASALSKATRQLKVAKWNIDSVLPAWQDAVLLHFPDVPCIVAKRV